MAAGTLLELRLLRSLMDLHQSQLPQRSGEVVEGSCFRWSNLPTCMLQPLMGQLFTESGVLHHQFSCVRPVLQRFRLAAQDRQRLLDRFGMLLKNPYGR